MKRGISLLLCMLLALSACAFGEETHGGLAFALEWMKSNSVRGQENAVISPVSAYLALTMAAMGAEGETWDELARVFGENEEWPEHAAALMKTFTKDKKNRVKIANSVWTDSEVELQKGYRRTLKRTLEAQTFSAALSEESGMKAMNDWVKENTDGMIERLLLKPLSEDTVLALINTVYFKGQWSEPFPAEHTQKGEFTRDNGETVETDFMCREDDFRYWALEDGAQAIRIPYEGDEKAFLAILPPEGVSADEYLNELSADTLAELQKPFEAADTVFSAVPSDTAKNGTYERIILRMPRIDAECTFDVKAFLSEAGVTRAFDPARAQLGEMLKGDHSVWIGQVIQKTRLKLDEKGTEASAVTLVSVDGTSAMISEKPIELTLDRSFLYLLYDENAEMPLFMGKVTSP